MKANNVVVGVLAHTDSGKTTLSESMLYLSGTIRTYGRVDHGDTFLDTDKLEKSRGITIFSKQAQMRLPNKNVSLLDTPGHVDFSAEMERTLQVLDYAILVISASDGIQGHTQTLWKLLRKYQVPTFIFVNKMDQVGADKNAILSEIQRMLSENCIDFGQEKNTEMFMEQIALCEETLMEKYLNDGQIDMMTIRDAIYKQQIYPCYFGSALKQEGVRELLDALNDDMLCVEYSDEFAARVYKIGRDEQDNRLTYMKIVGGKIRVKDVLTKRDKDGNNIWEDKIDQIRVYSGSQYETINEISAGCICAVTGLTSALCGDGIGTLIYDTSPMLEPVLTYKVKPISECNIHSLYLQLCKLEEEEPELHIIWDEKSSEIHAQVMGEVQIEILRSVINERFNVAVEFDSGSIVYKETIEEKVVGIGHFEPLRHYAEVHLRMEPGEVGSGLEYDIDCSEDILDKNWQRLVMTHLKEKKHIGVLTGSEITDIKITLIAGKAHLKHTEGGDFRQATYRAIRHGLMCAKNRLLEPVYEYRLEVPQEMIGRAMTDIQRMYGEFDAPFIEDDMAILTGVAPVVTMRNYQREVISYTGGKGRIFYTLKGYNICHNEDEVINNIKYNPDADKDNPSSSVFCSHGAGFVVNWEDVVSYAHVDSGYNKRQEINQTANNSVVERRANLEGIISQEEIEEIFERTFGGIKKKRNGWSKTINASNEGGYKGPEIFTHTSGLPEYLLVDGYNIIFAWDELKELSKINIDSARDRLMDIMCNYQGYKKCELILVFDAYKVASNRGNIYNYNNIHVVFTKEAETADQYIEKFTHENKKKYNITVATSDRLEQMIIWGAGAKRLSANGLKEEIEYIDSEIQHHINNFNVNEKNYLFDKIDNEILNSLEKE